LLRQPVGRSLACEPNVGGPGRGNRLEMNTGICRFRQVANGNRIWKIKAYRRSGGHCPLCHLPIIVFRLIDRPPKNYLLLGCVTSQEIFNQ